MTILQLNQHFPLQFGICQLMRSFLHGEFHFINTLIQIPYYKLIQLEVIHIINMQSHNLPSNKSTYDKITLEKRVKLVEEVQNIKTSVAKAANKFGIKISTAKLILKKYRQEGTFFEKIKDKKERLRTQTHETRIENQNRISHSVNEEAIQTLPTISNNIVPMQSPPLFYLMPNYQHPLLCPLYLQQWNYFN